MTRSEADRERPLEATFIELVVESWRLHRLSIRMANQLNAGEGKRYTSQLRYFQNRLSQMMDDVGLKLVDLQGKPFDPGMAAKPLNLDDFGPDDDLLVDQMIEPIVMGPDGLRKEGTVMLRKVHT